MSSAHFVGRSCVWPAPISNTKSTLDQNEPLMPPTLLIQQVPKNSHAVQASKKLISHEPTSLLVQFSVVDVKEPTG